MLNTIISILGGVNTGFDVYSKASAIFKGNKSEEYLKKISLNIKKLNVKVERLSENILYASNLDVISDINNNRQKYVDHSRDVRELLEPVQQSIGEEILSSAIIYSPEKMQKSMQKNPWEVLENITPVNFVSPQPNPNKIPVLFNHNSNIYVGWQMKGILPLLFDCNFDEVNINEDKKDEYVYLLAESIGIETKGGLFTIILYKDMKLPANYKQIFSTAEDNQSAISLHILKGNNLKTQKNRTIGQFELLGIPAAPLGVPQLELSFFVDYEGVLTVSAVDIGTGKYESVTFRDIGVNKILKENAKTIINCPICSRKMRVPSYLYIHSTCPHCNADFDVKYGNYVRDERYHNHFEGIFAEFNKLCNEHFGSRKTNEIITSRKKKYYNWDLQKSTEDFEGKITSKYKIRSTPKTLTDNEVDSLLDNMKPKQYIANYYVDNIDGTVSDQATGLMWQKAGSSKYMSFAHAKEYIKLLNRKGFKNYTDWRLPTIEELISLLERKRMSNNLYTTILFDSHQKFCWSADARSSDKFIIVNFYSGFVDYWDYKCFVRAVRTFVGNKETKG